MKQRGLLRGAGAALAGIVLGALIVTALDYRLPAELPPVVPLTLGDAIETEAGLAMALAFPDALPAFEEPRLLVGGTTDAVTLLAGDSVLDQTVLEPGHRKNSRAGWLLTLPASEDRPLRLRVDGTSVPNFVGIGEAAALVPWALTWRQVWQDWPWAIAVGLAISGFACLGVFLLQRRSPAFGWGALTQLSWAANTAYFAADTIAIPLPLFWPLGWLTSALTTIGAWYFVRHVVGPRPGRLMNMTALAAAGLALALHGLIFLNWPLYLNLGSYGLGPLLLLIGAAILIDTMRGAARGVPGSTGLCVALAASLLVGIRDTLVDFGWLPASTVRYLHYVAPLSMAVVLGMILNRFARAMDRAATLGQRLETEVAAVGEAYERQVQDRLQRERQLALELERERLVREMHDGAGGHLVQALAIAERAGDGPEARAAIAACLDELALIADPDMQPRESLGALIDRLGERLEAAGVHFEARIDAITSIDDRPELGLDLRRIIQESVSNVLRHANASHVALALVQTEEPTELELDLHDDGRGFDPSEVGRGRGLQHLQRRAERLGGTLTIDSDESGTRLALRLPLETRLHESATV
ncbi:MAG: ATP-binding protein [Pseudomonadota bacterium]